MSFDLGGIAKGYAVDAAAEAVAAGISAHDAARLCRIPTDAEELWIMAVTSVPARMPRSGFLPSVTNRLVKLSEF